MVGVVSGRRRIAYPVRIQSLITGVLLGFCMILTVDFILIQWYLSRFESLGSSSSPSSSTRQKHPYDFQASRIPDAVPPSDRIREQRQQNRSPLSGPADATFNGAPLRLKTVQFNNPNTPQSAAHCIGDNYHETDAWKGRSCEFSFLCFDTVQRNYVVFQSHYEQTLRKHASTDPFIKVSSTLTSTVGESGVNDGEEPESADHYPFVSLGGINLKWGNKGIRRLKWFPEVRRNVTELTYYELPDNVVLVPFHSMNGANPGHLVWDDFLALYNLLDMFDLPSHNNDWLLMRHVLDDGQPGLWASCDFTDEKTRACQHMISKFIPLMLGTGAPYHWSTTQDFDFQLASSSSSPRSNLVCAKRGVAGIGALTDHGYTKAHGWVPEDYNVTHNAGRGGLFRSFRNFCLENLNLPTFTDGPPGPPYQIVFSVNSSSILSRVESFAKQIEAVRTYVPSSEVQVHVFQDLTLHEQMNIVNQAAVFISMCGGGAVTGMFLPPGASVILYYHERGGVRGGKHGNEATNTPAMLDWDLFNAIPYLRVHWMPRVKMDHIDHELALISLIRHELKLIEAGAFS